MNSVFIMLGSNIHPEINLELAKTKIALSFQMDACSEVLVTEPVGSHYLSPFTNIAIKVLTLHSLEETKLILKQIEMDMGRTLDCKKLGIIPIDIDLIFWNEDLVHRDYNRFPFVKTCIDQLMLR
jgi:2-amino-4-hydroxy-6-hydroxymethyldihydropteridine diphosphokinase